MIEKLKGFYAKKADMTVGEFRDILNTSRKYALPFLEYLDSSRITMRVGDIRNFFLRDKHKIELKMKNADISQSDN